MSRKYIIVETLGHPVPILFSPLIDHSTFLEYYHKDLIVSAGFFDMYSGQDNHDYHYVGTHGGSTTLKIKCHPGDKKIIEEFLNRN